MKRGIVTLLTGLGAAALWIMLTSPASALEKKMAAGEVWEVIEATTLFSLSISEGADIRAPEGHTVTMTVDGVGTAIAPGYYMGDVVLTINREIRIDGAVGDKSKPRAESDIYRTAVYIENGKYVPEKSIPPMVTRGSVTDTDARDIKIISREGWFNGVMVTGEEKSAYTLSKPMIILAGNGGNDASGRGHGIMATGNAEVFIEEARLYNAGANRTAVFVGGHGIVHVNDSEIEVHNGPKADAGSGKDIMAPPWHLGITGNCRATRLVDSAAAHFTNTNVKSQGWGALSTDSSEKIRLTATGCLIETRESGYGACSTGGGIHTYSGCTFDVADYGVILGGNATHIITDRTVVNSGKIGVMMHSGAGGRLVIEKGSMLNTGGAIIQVRGRGGEILVDGAILNTESGVVLQSMPGDDNLSTPGMGTGENSRNVNAVFKNTVFKGDIINSHTDAGPMNVTFENATITGAITTGTVEPSTDPGSEELSPERSPLTGESKTTYCARFENPHGISVTLDETSAWVVDKTSYLTHLDIAKNRSVTAPYGYRVTMTVNGEPAHLNEGSYDGEIVLTVNKL